MNAYLMSLPAIVPCVCHPQYWVQNPLDAVVIHKNAAGRVDRDLEPASALGCDPLQVGVDAVGPVQVPPQMIEL